MKSRDYLTKNILPFWLSNGIDKEYGGIFTQLDREGKIFGEEKSVWFQGRALWVFSKAYNVIEKNPEYLEAAKHIYEFLPKCVDSDGRMFFTVTRDGRCIQKRRYFFSESFAAIGCAEYYKATGDEAAFKNAEKYFDMMYKVYSDPSASVPKFNPETIKTKSLSPVMILLSTVQILRSCAIDTEKYDKIAKLAIDEIIYGGFLNSEANALLENVTIEGDFQNTPTGRIVNPGHSLEAAWFVMAEGIITGDNTLLEKGREIIDITMPKGLDKTFGGIYAFIDVLGKPQQQLEWDMKLWWPQNEAIIANAMAYHLFDDKKYKNDYDMLYEYAFSHFADSENGEWYGYLHYDGTVSNTLKGNIFKGPFHLPRMLMILTCLEENKIMDFLN